MENIKMSTTSKRNSSNIKPPVLSEKDNSGQHKINDNSYINSHLTSLPDAKWIQIYINGDEHFSGCRCVINNRYYRNLDMFLNYLTERLKPSFGAFRNIYTPVNGHPVLRLEDLISKNKYVVAGNERFKKLDFGYTDADKKLKRNSWKSKNKFKVSKAKPLCHNALSVFFHQNGNFKAKPCKVSFLPQDLESWDLVYRKIREVMKCGPLKRIYSLGGKAVLNVPELVNNQSYVIVKKHEVLKIGHYDAFSQHNNSSSKGKYLAHRPSRKSSSVLTGRTSGVYSRTSARSSKVGFTYSASNQQENGEDSAHNSLNVTELGNGIESLDSFNPYKFLEDGNCNGNIMKIDLDDDLSGIFRSKNENHLTAGAVEIEDSPETVIDLPVDLLDAEEVEDEITPDMERSLQHLSLDVPDEIVAYLPAMQNKQNSGERQVSENKYNLNHSQTIDMHNLFV